MFSDLKLPLIMFCVISLIFTGYGYTKRIQPKKPTQGVVNELKKYMTDDETFVVFGAAPFLYNELLRSTPYPFLNSLQIYETSKPNSKRRKEVIRKLLKALQDKRVKFFIVHHHSTIPFYSVSEDARQIIGKQIGIKQLRTLNLIKNTSVFEFDIFEKVKI